MLINRAAQGLGASCGDSGSWTESNDSARWTSARNGADCVVTIQSGSVDGAANAPWSKNNPLDNQVTVIDFANGSGAVRFGGNIAVLFSSLPLLKQVRIDNPDILDTSGTDGDFLQMFANSPKLQNPDLSAWKGTSRPKKMAMMFMGDTALTNVDLSGWNTSAVTDMSSMFRGDTALSSVNVSGWNVSAFTDMSGMFLNDAALTSVAGLQEWTQLGASVPTLSLSQMFSGAASLTSLDLST